MLQRVNSCNNFDILVCHEFNVIFRIVTTKCFLSQKIYFDK